MELNKKELVDIINNYLRTYLDIPEADHFPLSDQLSFAIINSAKCRCDEGDPRRAHTVVCYKCGKEWEGCRTVPRVRE